VSGEIAADAAELLKRVSPGSGRDDAWRRISAKYEASAKQAHEARDFDLTLERLDRCLRWGAPTNWTDLRLRLLKAQVYRRLGRVARSLEEIAALEDQYGGGKDVFIKNLLLNEREITEGRTILKSFPTRATIRLTNRCNIRCVMCEMPTEKAWNTPKSIIDELSDLSPYMEDVQWQGGEIFVLNRDYLQGLMERAARNPYLGQSIITNALLIDKRWAEVLVRCGVHVRISIDGSTREVYEKIRAGGKWDDLLAAIDNMNEEMERQGKRIPLELHMVVMRSNHHQIADMMEFAHEHRFGTLDLSHVCGEHFTEENIFLNPDAGVWKKIQEQRALAREKGVRYGILFGDALPFPPAGLLPDEAPKRAAPVRDAVAAPAFGPDREPTPYSVDKPGSFFCISAWKKIIVRDSGALITNWHCDRDIGHVDRTTLMQAWNGPEMQLYRKRIVENTQQGLCTAYCLSGALIDPWRDQMEWNWS
jgi:MoaA/NifB/PqqE/SkfB family radical SAM enzyme